MKRTIIYIGIFSFLTAILLSCSREMEQTYPAEDTLLKSLSSTPNEYYNAELKLDNQTSLVKISLGEICNYHPKNTAYRLYEFGPERREYMHWQERE